MLIHRTDQVPIHRTDEIPIHRIDHIPNSSDRSDPYTSDRSDPQFIEQIRSPLIGQIRPQLIRQIISSLDDLGPSGDRSMIYVMCTTKVMFCGRGLREKALAPMFSSRICTWL